MIEVRNALIVPPRIKDGNMYISESGVFTEEGTFVSESLSIVDGQPRHGQPPYPDTKAPDYRETFISGTHALGGIFYGHFGHFITESTGRLWATEDHSAKLDSFIFIPKQKMFRKWEIKAKVDLLSALGISTKIRIADGPTRVERLLVPSQDFGLDPDLIYGSERYVSFIRSLSEKIVPEGAEKLYISRETLDPSRATILGEKFLQTWLSGEGYRIFEPQKYSVQEQMAQYRAARKIISVDASPLHLAAYAAHPDQRFSIIKRRSTDAISKIVSQLESFGNSKIQVIDCLDAEYTSDKFPRIGRSSWGEVDFCLIGQNLKAAGMIEDPSVWRKLSASEVSTQLNDLHQQTGSPYRLKKS